MRKIDIVGIAFGNFRRRKTRSALTVLGVVIGTASIVTMMSLGIAMNVSFREQLKQVGDLTTVTVNAGVDQKTGQQNKGLGDSVVKMLQELPHVTAVSPEMQVSGKLVCGKYLDYADIRGVNPEYMEKLGMKIDKGKPLSTEETSSRGKFTCVIGSEVAYQFYDPKAPNGGMGGGMSGGSAMGDGSMATDGTDSAAQRDPPPVDVMSPKKKIRFTFDSNYGEKNTGNTETAAQTPTFYEVQVSGVLKNHNGEDSYAIYVSMNTAKRLYKEMQKFNKSQSSTTDGSTSGQNGAGKQQYSQIKVITDNLQNTLDVTKQIQKLGYQAYSNADWITSSQQQVKLLQTILAAIGGVSLLVAAIGITNTMIMSIYERTKEIGIMKVIGCYLKDIRTMFLTEAGFIGLFGGAIGVGLSYGISAILNFLAQSGGSGNDSGGGVSAILGSTAGAKLSIIPWWLALAAVGFAILISLLSGFLPARRAMRLSALEAIRN